VQRLLLEERKAMSKLMIKQKSTIKGCETSIDALDKVISKNSNLMKEDPANVG